MYCGKTVMDEEHMEMSENRFYVFIRFYLFIFLSKAAWRKSIFTLQVILKSKETGFSVKIQWKVWSQSMFWKALPHVAAAPSHTPVSSQNQPQTAPKLSWVWAERQKRWLPGTWRRQRGELSVKFLQNIQSLSNHSRWRGLQRSHLFDSHAMILVSFTQIYSYLFHFFLPRSKVWHTGI